MQDLTKSQKRHLRDLAAKAHDRELSAALRDLLHDFGKWQAKEITALDLNELIHKHHDGISRELYRLYAHLHPEMSVARALVNSHLTWEEIPEDCRPVLDRTVRFIQEGRENADRA